jgi:hypothetical protein
MENQHPHTGATYRIISQQHGTYGVEVKISGTHPTLVTNFATEDAAKAWVARHQREVAEGNSLRRNL